jgi:hypothetical protein
MTGDCTGVPPSARALVLSLSVGVGGMDGSRFKGCDDWIAGGLGGRALCFRGPVGGAMERGDIFREAFGMRGVDAGGFKAEGPAV